MMHLIQVAVVCVLSLGLPVVAQESLPAVKAEVSQKAIGVRPPQQNGDENVAELLRVARDRNLPEEVRLVAIRGLRLSAPDNRTVFLTLRDLALSFSESSAIRRRALQSLGRIISLPTTSDYYQEALSAIRKVYSVAQSKEVLVMAIKAMHWATVNEQAIRRLIFDLARPANNDEPIRVAALWAIGSVSQYPEITPMLVKAVLNPSESDEVRNQALKSLYFIAGREEIWPIAKKIAANQQNNLEFRETATLFLSGAKIVSQVEEFLNRLRLSDPEPRIRFAADKALDAAKIREIWTYFRVRYDPVRHRMFEILEFE